MRVTVREIPGEVTWTLVPERDDVVEPPRKPRLARDELTFRGARDDEHHPDVLALCAALALVPWARSLTLDRGVSAAFAEAARRGLDLRVGPVDPALEPRRAPADGRPGLAYSGGADCTAALVALPDDTAAYFLERVTPPGQDWVGAYDKSAPLHACEELRRAGRTVRVVQSDLEFLRAPHGFPHDLANAIPAILSADRDRLDAIAWGAILESTYQVGSARFRDYAASPFVRQFGPLFDAVGLPVTNPVAGVSEVGTAMILRASPWADVAQSCMRGTVGQPCRRCWKCARKILLESALTGSWPGHGEIVRMLSRRNTPTYLRKEPIKHEGVVAYFCARYPRRDDGDLLAALARRVDGYPTDWLERWYVPSLEHVPERYRAGIAARLDTHLARMTPDDETVLTGWDMRPLVDSPERRAATERFLTMLEARTAPSHTARAPGPGPGARQRLARWWAGRRG